jgi:hypothetical protein
MKRAPLIAAIAVFCFASAAAAQQYYIRPTDSKRDLERRIWQLERAVQELQNKVYQLETQPPPPAAEPKNWLCKASAFGQSFSAFGATKVEAGEKVTSECQAKGNAEMHCRPTCTKNE